MADMTHTTWAPPLRKDGSPFPDIEQLARLPDYEREFYVKILRDEAPPPMLLAEAVARAEVAEMKRVADKACAATVYFIQTESGPIKIGYATDARSRLSSMQSGSFERLTLLCTTQGGAHLEAKFHHRFRAHWLRGEWFRQHPEILDVIDEIKAATEVETLSTPTVEGEGM